MKVVVIGGGVGGLTTAALLASAGVDTTVLEAHVYPGGSAGTFYHQRYRFDAGATLAGGFYPGGPMDIVAQAIGLSAWPAHPANPAMTVHLPGGKQVTRYTDERRDIERREKFGASGMRFFAWQERTADALWDLALRFPPWPPQRVGELASVAGVGLQWLAADPLRRVNPGLLRDAFGTVGYHLRNQSDDLRQFIDGQLLIAAQTTSEHANALFGASALDLPRRGVVHLEGGMGAIAEVIAEQVKLHGGKVLYRTPVERIIVERGRVVAVETRRGDVIDADVVIANLPPWNIRKLMGHDAPAKLQRLPDAPQDGWGAFMVYLGIDGGAIPADSALHHQVLARRPYAEGNTVFVSLSPAWDASRAPAGKRAVTLSTHTRLKPWWDLFEHDREAYEQRKAEYLKTMLAGARVALPRIEDAAELTLPGTPVTFRRFTRREWGWVGGFPQTSLFRAWGPRLMPGLWMVGDSIFPGQSTAAVALGGIRVARMLLASRGVRLQADTRQQPTELAPPMRPEMMPGD